MDGDRIWLYQHIVSQLEDDGLHGAASAVAQAAMIRALRIPRAQLTPLDIMDACARL
jgi:hypothetical protein